MKTNLSNLFLKKLSDSSCCIREDYCELKLKLKLSQSILHVEGLKLNISNCPFKLRYPLYYTTCLFFLLS